MSQAGFLNRFFCVLPVMSQPGLRQGNRTQGLGRHCSSTKASVAKEDWTERHENYYMLLPLP